MEGKPNSYCLAARGQTEANNGTIGIWTLFIVNKKKRKGWRSQFRTLLFAHCYDASTDDAHGRHDQRTRLRTQHFPTLFHRLSFHR